MRWSRLRCIFWSAVNVSRDVEGTPKLSAALVWDPQRVRKGSLLLKPQLRGLKVSSFMPTIAGWVFSFKIICCAEAHSILKRHWFPSVPDLGHWMMRVWINLLGKHTQTSEMHVSLGETQNGYWRKGVLMICYSLGTSATVETGACCTNTPTLILEEAAVGKTDGKRLHQTISRWSRNSDGRCEGQPDAIMCLTSRPWVLPSLHPLPQH